MLNMNLNLSLSSRLLSWSPCLGTSHLSVTKFANNLSGIKIRSINLWRVLRSGFVSFENKEKLQGATSDKYGGWETTHVSCLAKKSFTIILEYNGAFTSLGTSVAMTRPVWVIFDLDCKPINFTCTLWNISYLRFVLAPDSDRLIAVTYWWILMIPHSFCLNFYQKSIF